MRGRRPETTGRMGALAALAIALATATGGGVPGTGGAEARAQADGTPAAAHAARELLLQATLERTSEEPASLTLLRITLDPGGTSPPHAHPGVEFGVVEAGRLVVRVSGRAVTLPAGAGSADGSQPVPDGVEVTLAPGDRIAYAAGTVMTFRNPGPGTTSLLAATVLPAGPEAPPGAVYPGGTPTAEDAEGVRSRILGEAVTGRLPPGRSAITLERLALGAGDGVPGYAGPALLAVEAGGLFGSVRRGGEAPGEGEGTPGATPAEAEEFRLAAGQAIFLPEGMAQTPALTGDGAVVLLRLGVVALPEEAGEATPAATEEETATADGAEGEPAAGDRVVVAVAEARLRAAPSTEAEVLAGLEQGRALTVLGPAETDPGGQAWLPVEDASDPGLSGYVAVELVAAEEGEETGGARGGSEGIARRDDAAPPWATMSGSVSEAARATSTATRHSPRQLPPAAAGRGAACQRAIGAGGRDGRWAGGALRETVGAARRS